MTARIIETEHDELTNRVVSGIWKDRYNHERLIIDMIYRDVSEWSDKELVAKLHTLQGSASE